MRKNPTERAPKDGPVPLKRLEENRSHMSVVPLGAPPLRQREASGPDPEPEQFRSSLLRFRRLFEISTDGILILDWSTGRIIDANPRALEFFHALRDELRSKSLYEIGVVESRGANDEVLRTCRLHPHRRHTQLASTVTELRGQHVELAYSCYVADGIREIQCRIRTVAEPTVDEPEAGRVIEELRSLVFDLQRRGDQLHELANRDALTGLFNRRYLDDSLSRELSQSQRRGGPLCVVAMDIDRFKRFNDSFGHEAGDLALRECARLMTQNLRSGDIACRIGGDEFILVLPDCTADQARVLVVRLCELIKRLPLEHDDRHLDAVTLSAGVSEEVEGAWCARRLLRGADEALYAAKRAGGDRVVLHQWPRMA